MRKYNLEELLNIDIPEYRARRIMRGIERPSPKEYRVLTEKENDIIMSETPTVPGYNVRPVPYQKIRVCKICKKEYRNRNLKYCSGPCQKQGEDIRSRNYGGRRR